MTFIEPNADIAFFTMRLALAVIFFAYGPTKFQDTAKQASAMGITTNQMLAIGTIETLGALSMLTGLFIQEGAAALILVMLGAIYFKTQKWNKGFTGPGGWSLDFAIIALALAVLLGAPTTYTLF